MEYYQEDVLPEIDLERDVVLGKGWGDDGMMHPVSGLAAKVYPYAGLILVGAIVGYALLTGGAS